MQVILILIKCRIEITNGYKNASLSNRGDKTRVSDIGLVEACERCTKKFIATNKCRLG